MQVSGNSSRQRESGETSSWVALILCKWSWVTGMTLPLGQVKTWAFLVVHYNWAPCGANIEKSFLFGSTWSKQKLKRWINDRGGGNQSAPTGCHRCHFAFSPFDLGTAFTLYWNSWQPSISPLSSPALHSSFPLHSSPKTFRASKLFRPGELQITAKREL